MKKLLLASALVLAGATMSAQTPDQLRIYINPGHGSWTGNDRPMQIIGKPKYSSTNTDTTGFFESNTDLIKGFGVLETLIEMGFPFDRTLNQEGERWEIGAAKDLSQNVVMSRVKNGPYEAVNDKSSPNYELYNRSLSEIAAEVEYNEFDMFISIHSNASDEGATTNYHLFMYRGRNGIQNVAVSGSYEMAQAASKYSFANKHAAWSVGSTYINGDVDFMGGGSGSTNSLGYYGWLGVLKHGVPGYLVEGYFHTYQPARHRGMNWDVDFEEGAAYARGVAEYFEFDRDKNGDIYGIVRDEHEKFSHQLYKANAKTNDVYKPLNGVKVYLQKDGQTIREYTTDNFYNGAYVFFNLEPGTYTIYCEHPDYKIPAPQEVTVVPGDCVYPLSWLENKEWVTPEDLQFTYPDELGEGTAYGAADKYYFEQQYVDAPIAELEGKTIRRAITKGNRLYVLALDAANVPTIVVYDTESKKVVATPSTVGMDGTELNCSDIQVTADGVLVACNREKLQYSDAQIQEGDKRRGTLRFYRWENAVDGLPCGDPVNFISTQNSSLWYRTYAGNTFSYYGTLADGTITVANPSITGPNHGLRTLEITVADGVGVAESIHKPMIDKDAKVNPGDESFGADYKFIPSPVDKTKIWVVTSKSGIVELDNTTGDGPENITVKSTDEALTDATGATAFKYAGHSYLALPVVDGASNIGMTLYDVTAGLTDVSEVTTVGTTLDAKAASANRTATGVTIVNRDKTTNAITEAHINLTTLRDNSVSRFTNQGVDQHLERAPYAYDLRLSGDNGVYNLAFKTSGDAAKAELILTATDGSGEIVTDLGGLDEGAQSATVNVADLEETKTYNWAVRLTGNTVPSSGLAFTAEANLKANSRGGVAWISDPESANYGRIITSAGNAQGVTVYTPKLERIDTYLPEGNAWMASKLNSPYRIGQKNGMAYLTDWSDGGAGYWEFDASNPTTTRDVLGGERDSKGAHNIDGKSIGGGSTAVAFNGSGDDTYMYSFTEDFPAGNSAMALVRQKIGTASPWTSVPENFGGLSSTNLMKGTNVEIVALKDGIFVSQVAAENTDAKPGFVYLDNQGNIKFSAATLGNDLASCGSGIAITSDLATMAISENGDGIGIWDVEWADNTPSLTKRYVIPGSNGTDEVNQLSFDNAGNLYAWHRSNYGMRVYVVKNAAPVATTPAPKALVLSGDKNSVDNVAVDAENDAPVEYYDLQGRRIDEPTPGTVVIRRQGAKVTKIIVK